MKSKSKNKKSKIPLCPQKNKPIKKTIKINKISPILQHWKHPSTPSLSTTKNFFLNNNFNTLNNNNNDIITNKDNKSIDNNSSKKNPFHAFIPRTKSNSEIKFKKQKIILIKKVNKPNNIPFNFNNIKEFNYKKDVKDNINDMNLKENEFKKIRKEKDTLSSNNSHYMNNTKANTNSNTTIGTSQILSDRYTKDDNKKIFQDSKNPMEFTFGNLNFFQTQNNIETKASLTKNNSLNMICTSHLSIDNNKDYQNIDKNNNNKNQFMKNLIKNMKLINSKIRINNSKNNTEKNTDNINSNNYNNIKSYSIDKDYIIRDKNKKSKLITFPKWPKVNNNDKNKLKCYDEFYKSQKFSKKCSNLIPVDKKYNLNKKHKLIVKKHFDYGNNINNKNNNIRICISTKNKDNKKNLHKLFINQNSFQTTTKTNKSSPKLFLKHPSLKNLFDS